MGGYAACAFSSLSPNSIVIAFSPQSTLCPKIVGWETRFRSGRKADWNGPYSDAANELQHAKKAWIIYDPKTHLDQQHAIRLRAPNVTLLKASRTNHTTIQVLRKIGILSTIVRECVDESMSDTRFYELFRKRRESHAFLQRFAEDVGASKSVVRKERLRDILYQMKKPALADRLFK